MKNIEDKLRKISKIRMTENERILMRSNILKFMENHIPENYIEKSKQHTHSFYIFRTSGIVFASFLLLFAGSYKVTLAMPGDFLYSFKVNTIEEVRGAFIQSPQEKLLYSQSRVAKRIDEVITLVEAGDLTVEKSNKVEKALDSHIADIEQVAKELKIKNPENFKDTAEKIAPIMEQHKNELKEINEKANIVIEQKNKEEIPIISQNDKAVSNIDPATSTDKTVDTVTNTEVEKKKEETKKAVDNIIAKIEKETDQIKDAINTEEVKEEVKDKTKQNTQKIENNSEVILPIEKEIIDLETTINKIIQ